MFKKAALYLLVATFFVTSHTLISHEANPDVSIELSENIYVGIEQIHFANNKIYVHLEDSTYATPAIHTDEKGYFITKVTSSGDCAWYEWQCVGWDCGYCNLRGFVKCSACGRDMSGNR